MFSCNAQDCKDLSTNFKSYSEAINKVENTDFELEESIDTSSSSWVSSADYYSCDSKKGYLLIGTSSRTYIHKNVPVSVWNSFKKASSFGSFYNRSIKGKYNLSL